MNFKIYNKKIKNLLVIFNKLILTHFLLENHLLKLMKKNPKKTIFSNKNI